MTPFENLQQSISTLIAKIEELGDKVERIGSTPDVSDGLVWLNVAELQKYLPSHPKRQTIYSWTSSRQIPFHKKGRSIMFDKNEIDSWLQDSEHIKSLSDIEREAQDFVKANIRKPNK